MTVLVPRMEILPAQQRAIWPLLKPTVALGFVLYGGTAVALRSIEGDDFEGGDLRQLSYQDRQLLIEAVKTVKAIPDVDILDGRLSIRRLD